MSLHRRRPGRARDAGDAARAAGRARRAPRRARGTHLGARPPALPGARRLSRRGWRARSLRAASGAERGSGSCCRTGPSGSPSPSACGGAAACWCRINTLYRPRELGHALEHADVSLLIAVRGFLRHDYAASLEARSPGITRASRRALASGSLREVVLLEPAAPLDARRRSSTDRAETRAGVRRRTTRPRSSSPRDRRRTPKGAVHTHAALRLAAEGDAAVLGIEARGPHVGLPAVLLRRRSGGGGAGDAVARRSGGAAGRLRAGRDAASAGARARDACSSPGRIRPRRSIAHPRFAATRAPTSQGRRRQHEVGGGDLPAGPSRGGVVRHDGDAAALHRMAVGRAARATRR